MPTPRLLSSLFLSSVLLVAGRAGADTITLKNGDKIQGKVVQETDTEMTIEIKTASITDSQTVRKADVAKIDKEVPDEVAYLPLKTIKLGANSVALERYDALSRPLQAFVNQFPQSSHVAEITQMLTAISEEKTRVEGGEIKLAGKWISPEEVQRERYQLGAQVTYAQMQDQARRGDLIGALNTFDQVEKIGSGANVYPDAVTLARQILPQVKTTADRALQTWLVQRKERDTNTQLASEPNRSQLLARQAADQAQLEAAFDAAAGKGIKWPPLQPQNEKGLATLSAKVEPELKRLEVVDVAKLRQSIQLTEKGRGELAAQNLTAADETFKQALARWSTNEVAIRLQKEMALAQQAKPKATPEPMVAASTPAPATPEPRATPAAVPTEAATPAAAVADEEKVGFFRSPVGLGLLVILCLGGGIAYLSYKKKQKLAAETEQFEE